MLTITGSAASNRRENRLLVQARLAVIDSKLDKALKEVGASALASAPTFPTEADIAEVGVLIVEGKVRLPRHATFTVETEIEERKDPAANTTSTIYNHTFDSLLCHRLQPMSIQAAIEAGLLVRLGSHWLWCESSYRRLVPPDPRLVT
jgi:hypothetical protein